MLVIGSRTLVHTLLVNGLVDELRLVVFPVVLGSGFRWYPESREKFHMALAGMRRFPNDVVLLTYVPTAPPSEVVRSLETRSAHPAIRATRR